MRSSLVAMPSVALGSPAKADDEGGSWDNINSHYYYDFGERFMNGGNATEKIQIKGKAGTAWAGLYIEADVTLAHTHVPGTEADCVNDQLTVRALEKRVQKMHAPVAVKQVGTPDLPEGYVRSLADKLKKHFGCAVRITSGVTHANGRHVKGLLEIDFFDNDELDRIIQMIGIEVD